MPASDLVIRRARPEDATPIARLHVRVWRDTYREMAPDSAKRILDLPYRHAVWVKLLAQADRTVLVAERAERIVGIGCSGPATVPALEPHGEIGTLYVDIDQAGGGIGRRMMAALAGDLKARGFASAALGVVAANEKAIGFYERLGGRRIGHYTDPGPHWRSANAIYLWDDLAALLRYD